MARATVPHDNSSSVPPQNLEAEESVLGAMMISPGAIVAVREVLDPGDFYRDSHAKIYRAALALHDAGEPVDAITLTSEIERRGDLDPVGGRVRLHELARLVPATANARHYAELVRDMSTLRGLIRAGGEIAQLGWDREGSAADILERARTISDELHERGTPSGHLEAQTWAEFERDATEHIPLLVDQLWPEAGLGFIAAPPKKGKTWVGLDLAISVATGTPFLGQLNVDKPAPVLVVALEGHKAAIRGRIGCLTRGRGLDPSKGSSDLKNLHVLYKPAGINLADPVWTRTIHELVARIGARLVVVDVLRAAAVLKENSNDEFGVLVRALQPITLSGCAVALLHHFGKLTEISRERSAGERMAGAGAMQGAYDVGVFITGSDDHARRLRVEFEARDLPAPDPIGVYLDGETSGPNGGFTFNDAATWGEAAEIPDAADLSASPEEVKAWLALQPGRAASQRDLAFAMEVTPKTIERRRVAYQRAGIVWEPRRGTRPNMYRLPDPDPADEQNIQQELQVDSVQLTRQDTTGHVSSQGMSSQENTGYAGKTGQELTGQDTTGHRPVSSSKNGHFAGTSQLDTVDIPYGDAASLSTSDSHPDPADDDDNLFT